MFVSVLFRKNRLPFLLKAALGFGLGTGCLSWIMLILGIVNSSYSFRSIATILFALGVFFLMVHFYQQRPKGSPNRLGVFNEQIFHGGEDNLDYLGRLAFVFILGRLAYSFVWTLKIPLYSWDSFSTIFFNAKIIFFDRSIENLSGFAHPEYPLYTQFLTSWLAMGLGEFADQWLKVIFPLASVGIVIILYYFLCHFVEKNYALLGCAIMLFSEKYIYHSSVAYNEIILLYYHSVTILLLLLWYHKKDFGYFVLSALFAGITASVKMEGLYYFSITLCVCGILLSVSKEIALVKKFLLGFLFSLPVTFTSLAYACLRWRQGINYFADSRTHFVLSFSQLQRIPLLIEKLFRCCFVDSEVNLIWILFVVLFFFVHRNRKNMEVRALLFVLLLHFGLISVLGLFSGSGIYIVGPRFGAVLPRLTLHFFVFVPTLIILLYFPGKRSLQLKHQEKGIACET